MTKTYYTNTKTYYSNPAKARGNYSPTLYHFDCHYGSRILTVRAEYPHIAREKAAAYFKTGGDKILVRRS